MFMNFRKIYHFCRQSSHKFYETYTVNKQKIQNPVEQQRAIGSCIRNEW